MRARGRKHSWCYKVKIFYKIKLADIISLISAVAGFGAIIAVFDSKSAVAAVLLVISAVLDWCDGKVARARGSESEWGKSVDSLADIVAFGVAPGIFAWQMMGANNLFLVFPALIIVCGILRLARYNSTPSHGFYIGMPITLNGLIFPIIYFLRAPPIAVAITCVAVCFAMIADFRIRKR